MRAGFLPTFRSAAEAAATGVNVEARHEGLGSDVVAGGDHGHGCVDHRRPVVDPLDAELVGPVAETRGRVVLRDAAHATHLENARVIADIEGDRRPVVIRHVAVHHQAAAAADLLEPRAGNLREVSDRRLLDNRRRNDDVAVRHAVARTLRAAVARHGSDGTGAVVARAVLRRRLRRRLDRLRLVVMPVMMPVMSVMPVLVAGTTHGDVARVAVAARLVERLVHGLGLTGLRSTLLSHVQLGPGWEVLLRVEVHVVAILAGEVLHPHAARGVHRDDVVLGQELDVVAVQADMRPGSRDDVVGDAVVLRAHDEVVDIAAAAAGPAKDGGSRHIRHEADRPDREGQDDEELARNAHCCVSLL